MSNDGTTKKRKARHIAGHIAAFAVCLAVVSCGVDKAVKKGDKYYALGEYYDAAAQYKKAYQMTPPKEREARGQRAKRLAEVEVRPLTTTQSPPCFPPRGNSLSGH